MTSRRSIGIGLAVAVVLGSAANAPTGAQNAVYAYPMAGQSLDQQQQDNWECHNWSVQQSGFDPQRPPPAPRVGYSSPPPQQSSGVLGLGQGAPITDAAKGAATGAIFGAIAGDAGKGAAIGAVTTTLFGGIKRRNRQQQEQQWRQQQYQQQQYEQQQYEGQIRQLTHNYNRAFAACMSARQYQVQ